MKETEVVVLGAAQYGGAWGKGATREKALLNAVKEGLVKAKGFTVLTFGPESEFVGVNGLGNVTYKGPEPVVEDVAPRKAKV